MTMIAASTSRTVRTTWSVGLIGVRLVRIAKVSTADSSARATAIGPRIPVADFGAGALTAASAIATSSTVVMGAVGSPESDTAGLVHDQACHPAAILVQWCLYTTMLPNCDNSAASFPGNS